LLLELLLRFYPKALNLISENKKKLKQSLLHQILPHRNPDKLNLLIPKQEIKVLKELKMQLKQVRINLLREKLHLHLEEKRPHRQAKHLLPLQEKPHLLLGAKHHLLLLVKHHLPLLGRHHPLLPERPPLHNLLPEKHLHLLLQVKHHLLRLLAKVLHHLLLLLVRQPLPLLQELNLLLNQWLLLLLRCPPKNDDLPLKIYLIYLIYNKLIKTVR
jgi:hypothetical protein